MFLVEHLSKHDIHDVALYCCHRPVTRTRPAALFLEFQWQRKSPVKNILDMATSSTATAVNALSPRQSASPVSNSKTFIVFAQRLCSRVPANWSLPAPAFLIGGQRMCTTAYSRLSYPPPHSRPSHILTTKCVFRVCYFSIILFLFSSSLDNK